MSFKLFIYYCALCGGWAAFVGWAIGRSMTGEGGFVSDIVMGLFLGLAVALALGVTDAILNLSRRRHGQVVARGLLGGLLGGISGFLGAAVGNMLFTMTGSSLVQIAGWTLVGLLVGASVGLYDFLDRLRAGDRSGGGLRKVLNGLIGGTLGGIVGGVLFVLLTLTITAILQKPSEQLLSTGATGFVILGACIGLFIGLAQVILKEAWVRVETGRRAGREMILVKEETSIGRAEACDIGLFGDNAIERMHARILCQKSRYLLADNNTPSGTYLNEQRIDRPTPLRSGDAIRVGSAVLRFGERRKRK
jgi:hypothetical protein